MLMAISCHVFTSPPLDILFEQDEEYTEKRIGRVRSPVVVREGRPSMSSPGLNAADTVVGGVPMKPRYPACMHFAFVHGSRNSLSLAHHTCTCALFMPPDILAALLAV